MKNTFVKIITFNIFIITTAFHLQPINNVISSACELSNYHNLITVELVINSQISCKPNPANQSAVFELKDSKYDTYDFKNPSFKKFPVIFTLFSLGFQVEANQQIYCPGQSLVSILQKSHIWHQSSEDDPPNIINC